MSAGDPAVALAANKKTLATAERGKTLRSSFVLAESLARVDECLAALAVYQNGTLTLQKAIEQQQATRSARGTAYFAFATEISDVAQNAVAAMRGQALQSETGLGQTVSMLVVGSALAVLLAGGSAFGLVAAGGVGGWVEARGLGLRVGAARG